MIVGIDIGGANLKFATVNGQTCTTEFPLWLRPQKLASQLIEDLSTFKGIHGIAVTMTGELADCFLDRSVGVKSIVESTLTASQALAIKDCKFYSVDGMWLSAEEAVKRCDAVAAANWHAMATWIAAKWQQSDSLVPRPGLMVDVGSTTTDLIPFKPPTISTDARTDFDRLSEGTLIYLGGGRTPICSIVQAFRYGEREIPLMREVFATMDDVRILLGHCQESPAETSSADGKPRDRRHSMNRIARMIGLDHRHVKEDAAVDFAHQVHLCAKNMISRGIASLTKRYRLERLMLLGHSQDLVAAPTGLDLEVVDLRQSLGDDISRVGPAFAVAALAENEFTD